jgi:hypothetical protein
LEGYIKLSALKALCVTNCVNIKCLPLDIEHFPKLETLLVDNCEILEFSEGHEDQNSNMRLRVITIGFECLRIHYKNCQFQAA